MARRRPTPQEFEAGLEDHFRRGLFDGQIDEPTAARWADLTETTTGKWAFGSEAGMLFLGYRNGQKVGRADDRHQITIGGSRSGKGVSLINPVLLTYEGSAICIDPKGELARVTAAPRRKRLGATTIVLDPFNTTKMPTQCFNPLAEIKQHDPTEPDIAYPYAIDDALAIAESLVMQSTSEAHWSDAARSLVQALILMALVDSEDKRNLVTVRDYLMLRDPAVRNYASANDCDPDTALFKLMQELYIDLFDNLIVGIGSQFLSMGEKERGSILSTARTQTAFLDSPRLRRTLLKSDFSLADLKRKNTTLYLCLPASRMGAHARWLRTIITLALAECERVTDKPPLPVLFVLDEFAVLGHMRAIESAAGQMAGFDVKLWTILQDLSQLKDAYKGTWETFFGNAAVATFHGIADTTTLEYLSKRLGMRTFPLVSSTTTNYADVASGRPMTQESHQQQPLAAPHELEFALARERGRMVVLYAGSHPLLLERAVYHDDPYFKALMA